MKGKTITSDARVQTFDWWCVYIILYHTVWCNNTRTRNLSGFNVLLFYREVQPNLHMLALLKEFEHGFTATLFKKSFTPAVNWIHHTEKSHSCRVGS